MCRIWPYIQLKLRDQSVLRNMMAYGPFSLVVRGQIPAQVLIGVDTSHVFPVSVVNDDGTPVQTRDARLMRSMLTGRYLLFGSAKEDDELFHQKFPEIDKNGLAGVAHLGAEAVRNELAEYYQSCLEDVRTM